MKTENLPILGEGGSHIVYDTGDGNVLKCPKWIWRFLCNFEMISEDVRLATEYFEDYFWPTSVVRDAKNTKGYTMVQPILPPYSPLTLGMLEAFPELRGQFDDFLDRNEILYREKGRAFDFFGLEGMVIALVAKEGVKEGNDIVHVLRKIFGQLVAKVFLGKDEIGKDIPITNLLVIERDGLKTICVADPTLTNEQSTQVEDRIFTYCCNSLNKRYMKKHFNRDILIQPTK